MTGDDPIDLTAVLLDLDTMRHLDRVPWWEAPIPRRFHLCRAWSTGYVHWLTSVDRCACGAISIGGHRWMDRNSRRRS